MRNIIGQPVTGKDFFERPKLTEKIQKALDANKHILISAPRRAGKTSILLHLRECSIKDYYFIYIDSGTLSNEGQYYDRIYKELYSAGIVPNLPSISSPTRSPLKYKEDLIRHLDSHRIDKRLVIMVDEFLKLVENIIDNEGLTDAVQFLKSHREFRRRINNGDQNVRFIYTSSYCFRNAAGKIDANKMIDDLYPISIPPLSVKEANKFIHALLEDAGFGMKPAHVRHLCNKLKWLTPFHIQLFFYELDNIYVDQNLTEITNSILDDAMALVLKHEEYFEHLRRRLKTSFNEEEYPFVETLLDILSRQEGIPSHKIEEFAKMQGRGEHYHRFIQTLVNDGYISDSEKNGIYRFSFPLFKDWWYKQAIQMRSKTEKTPGEDSKKIGKEFKKIKIQRVKIQHIKCFEDVDIEFGTSSNTAIIIGTNGKGKSTILQLIGLGLSGVKNVPFTYNWKEVVKKNTSQGLFEIDVIFDNNPINLKFKIDSKDDSITCIQGGDQLESTRDTFVLLAYGVNRSIKLEETKPYKEIEAIATLFGENGYLKHIKVSSTFEYVRQHFETIQTLINKALEKADGNNRVILTHYDSNSFYFKTPSNPKESIPIEALSEGFKSTLVWLFDAIIRIVDKGGSLENAGDITGIILLDEVDLHLHPSWQRTILQSVETLFPNIQFIVTTHSPFVVQNARKEALIALEMERGSDNVMVVDKDITSELSYSAIVREIFNIRFPFSREIEQKMDKFHEMANAIRDNKKIDEDKFKQLVMEIAGKGVELEGIMRRELMNLQRRTGKTFDLWKK